MPRERDPVHLWDMLEAARGVMRAVHGLTFEQYVADENLRLAVERRVQIIGEAARRVSEEFRHEHPEIPWRAIIDQRNVLVHAYDEVADERIWRLTLEHLPHLIIDLERLVPTLPSQ